MSDPSNSGALGPREFKFASACGRTLAWLAQTIERSHD